MKLRFTLLCLLFAIATNIFTTAKAQVNTTDSLALVDLYNSTGGQTWHNHKNWLTTKPVGTWFKVKVTGTRVTYLNLSLNKLSGTIPASIGNLTNLTLLSLGYNQLTGTIPASIGNLTNLTLLSLGYNQLTGIIPAEIGNLVKLNELNLFNNQLTGTIPAEIGNLVKLNELNLFNNQLTGIIPAEIGNLVNLQKLHLYHNQLSGTIPVEIGNLANLQYLELDFNQLSGTIPSTLGNLTSLSELTLSNNRLSGAIPIVFSNFPHLTFINLSYNQLSQFGEYQSFITESSVTGYINNNLLNFDGLQLIANKYPYVSYAPQHTVLPIHQNGNTLSVSTGGSLGNNTYKWHQAGAANIVIIKKDSTFTPSQSGRYYVKVTNRVATDLSLHSDTISYTMPLAQAENSISNIAAIKVVNTHFSVYPNPATNSIHVQTTGNAIITLTSNDGKVLLTKTINNTAEINVSSFANGIYYLQNKTTGEREKIVVVH